jgi:hypothetical protein
VKKHLAPCALLLALATTTATVAHAAEQSFQASRCASAVAVQTGDPSLDQLASDAQALWHELSPEVREMVDEMLASRDKRNPIATMARSGCDLQPFSAARPLPGRAASATRPA